MRTIARVTSALVLLAGAWCAAAAEKETPMERGAALIYAATMASLHAISVEQSVELGQFQDMRATKDQALAEIEAALPPAIAAAKSKPDLQAALKAYYLAAKSYFRDGYASLDVPAVVAKSNAAKLKQEMAQAEDAMRLELKLAGMAE